MTTLELDIRKQRILNYIKNSDDEEIILQFEAICPPCQYTLEELKLRIQQGELDAQNGLGVTQEAMRKKHLA